MLAMDFDHVLPKLAHELHGNGLVIDVGFGPAIGRLDTAKDQVAIVIKCIFAKQRARGVIHADFESRGNLALVLTMANKATVTASTKGKRQAIEKNGFAGARLTSQHGKAGLEPKVEPFDQNDIADR
jgi:hypothetical protein